MTAQPDHMEAIYKAPEIEALFVQNAHGIAYEDGKLTLRGLAPTTLFFSDRPDRVTGHITSREFVGSWDKGEDSFASNPPNGALSIFHEDGVTDVVVELTEPILTGHDLTYTVEILDGDMPAEGGPSSLFIDVIGRPLSPMSVAGVRRREDRREDRRL